MDQHLLVLAAACSITSGALAVFGAYLPTISSFIRRLWIIAGCSASEPDRKS
jgi:hypothetical protein